MTKPDAKHASAKQATSRSAAPKKTRAPDAPVRAAVMIGVSKTGSLPQLAAAIECAKKMGAWATGAQQFARSRVKVITDEKKPVRADQVRDAVTALLKGGDVEQLIIYFAGHGVNNGGAEIWLLSGAPVATSEAINLAGSVELARYAGVPHVVFISDACRTAAEGIQAQKVTGIEIFPNRADASMEQPVDIFFASRLGAPSHEIKDPKDSAGRFKAVYTEALLSALEGKHTEVIEETQDGPDTLAFVRPRPLGDFLEGELTKQLKGVKSETGPIIQMPYARLTSRESEAWLSRFVERRVERSATGEGATRFKRVPARRGPSVEPPLSMENVAHRAFRAELQPGGAGADAQLAEAVATQVSGASMMSASLRSAADVTGAMHFESNCGFKVRGTAIVGAVAGPPVTATMFADSRELVRIENLTTPAASVLLEFEDGSGVVLPAIREFIGALHFDDGELISVAYEPSDRSPRWAPYAQNAAQFRRLRALATSAAQLGVFRLEGDDAAQLASMFQMVKNGDPAMALYAAYAYHDLRLNTQLKEMHDYARQDLGMRLFDVAMLAGTLTGRSVEEFTDVYPAFPLLAQGWSLLSAFRIALPQRLSDIRSHLLPSLWSVFDKDGVSLLRSAIQSGELQ